MTRQPCRGQSRRPEWHQRRCALCRRGREKAGARRCCFAARQGDNESAKLLLAAGADVNEEAPDGYSVMLLASHSGHGALASFLPREGGRIRMLPTQALPPCTRRC